MAAVYTFIAFIILMSSIQFASAGCAGDIFVCKGDKDPCRDKQCPQGQVCRVNNCRGCFANCEPPNMVHIMSLGPNPGSSSPGSSSSNDKVTQEAGPSRGGACACPRNYSPVCGTDGNLYNNECLAKCAKVSVTADKPDEQGNCKKGAYGGSSSGSGSQSTRPKGFTCRCAQDFKPVCGTDGQFYESECLAICEGVQVASARPDIPNKKCSNAKSGRAESGSKDSSSSSNPNTPSGSSGSSGISGISGSSSESSKALPKALVQQAPANEPTPKACPCPRILAPVCGSDGKQYDNSCLAECAAVTWAKAEPNTPCSLPTKAPADPQPSPKLCACPLNLAPVCGSDGKMYDNKCLAECAGVKVTSTDISKACKPAPKACPCPKILAPVCGSDGKKYNNKCLAECAGVTVTSADTSKTCAKPAKPARPEKQQPGPKVCPCPRIFDPVCGSDGVRYNNKCLAECAGVEATNADASKPCAKPAQQPPAPKACPCPRIMAPVCGSDGKQYDNKCLAQCAGVTWVDADPNKPCSLPTKAPPAQQPAPKACPCPKILAPVCGSDGKRYDNTCLAECAGVTVTTADASKPCEQPQAKPQKQCACPYILAPVCGSDGKLYSNECLAKCAGVTAAGRPAGPNKACPQ